MKHTAAAVAAVFTLISAAASAAPVFDGSTLQDGALKALPQDAGPETAQNSRQPDQGLTDAGQATASLAETPVFKDAAKEPDTGSTAPQKIFKDFDSTAKIKPEDSEAAAAKAPKASSPVIGKSIKSVQESDNPFLAAKADQQRVENSIASLLGIKLDPKHKGNPEQEKADLEMVKEMLQVASPLPVRSLIAVEANGNLVLMSENQRFIIKGSVYDAFNNMKELKTAADIRQYAFKTDYRRLGLDPETLNSARIGSGPLNVVIYADPLSEKTHQLMTEAMELPDLENYSFYFVMMPALTEESKLAALKFYCAREAGNPEAGNLLYQGRLSELKETQCDSTVWDRTMSAAYYTGVDVVPFFVGVDGSISRGIPQEGMSSWLTKTVPVSLAKLKDLQLKKELEENVTNRALQQDAEQEIADKEAQQGNVEESSPFADLPVQYSDEASALEADPSDLREFTDRKLQVRAKKLHDSYKKNIERLDRAAERSRSRYEKVLARTEGAMKQVRNYSDEKRQDAIARLNQTNTDAYEQHQERLREIASDRAETVKEYRADLQRLREQQAELQGE